MNGMTMLFLSATGSALNVRTLGHGHLSRVPDAA